jgi:uncharacterized protein RhaS with RHS repeats
MQARYYDPVIGRFYSNDPIGFRDVHSFNRYAYANNNPYKYVDPDGREVILSNEAKSYYQEAKQYLTSKSPLAKSYFSRIESKHFRPVHIELTNGGSEHIKKLLGGNILKETIRWNPTEGLVTSGGAQSPATGLMHEIIHSLVDADGVAAEDQDQMTIFKENSVNRQTGEGTRRTHGDGKVKRANSVTSTPEIEVKEVSAIEMKLNR